MTLDDLGTLKKWFADYTRTFFREDPEEQKNIGLKVEHSYQVSVTIGRMAHSLGLSRERVFLAEAVGLFHDIGRFPQYARYKTFRDNISINHGKLGADVLADEKVLLALPPGEQDLIVDAVRFHNAFGLPDLHSPEKLYFLKMVRDADKLDIWRIFVGFFEGSANERASEAGLGLPDLPGYSEDMIACIFRQQTASVSSIKSLNDFKLMQLSWVYDLNFSVSFAQLVEKDYIRRIISLLPKTDDIMKVSVFLQDIAHQKLEKASDQTVAGM